MKERKQRARTYYLGGPVLLFASVLGGIAGLIACWGGVHAADTKADRPLPRNGCAISDQVFGTFNVKCFGAKGDGTTDDTDAIQAAATAAEQAVAIIAPEGAAYTYMGSGPPVYFPPGIYRLTNEIAMGPYTFASGEGHPILRQDCATCRTLPLIPPTSTPPTFPMS